MAVFRLSRLDAYFLTIIAGIENTERVASDFSYALAEGASRDEFDKNHMFNKPDKRTDINNFATNYKLKTRLMSNQIIGTLY